MSYYEGDLSGPERGEFEQHLSDCAICQQELNRLRRLDQLTATVPQLELPAGLAASLFQTDSAARRRSWLLPSLGLAAAVALAALVFRPGRPPEMSRHSPELHLAPNLTSGSPAEGHLSNVLATSSTPQMWHSETQPLHFQLVGQKVILSPNSEIERISLDPQRASLKLRFGTVRIQETGQHISVSTSHLQVRPIGTDYQVSTNLKTSQVKVYQGAVEVRSDSRQPVRLQAGGSLTWPGPEQGAAPDLSPSPASQSSKNPEPPISPQLPDADYPAGHQPDRSHLPSDSPSPAVPEVTESPLPARSPDERAPLSPNPRPHPSQQPRDEKDDRPSQAPPGYDRPGPPPGGRPHPPGQLPPHLRPGFPGRRPPQPDGRPGI